MRSATTAVRRRRSLAVALCAATSLLVGVSGAATAQAATSGYREPGGTYPSFSQCIQAGSLSVALGLYSRYECNPSWNDQYQLWYVD
ncbi:hypothetical protein AB0C90_22170 [Streptomyces sp. NPDC048550]|uniref:hypothetical protein n=1 Tax=unclassified Streptomyces TaxID=2593676 RepID=UPI00224D42D4|nr:MULTISPECIES: hypothetical protein [unclassified Streptomyces]MCX5148898.1 hypothetical protein [Streptomyces sp. NBC_00320]WSN51954.1 hypothetical protein OG299_31845 [Streptomyces sp. NBC_01296]WSW58625.1 hypothetical protein OG513_08545 [Streptomyces sp. NBC_00998]